MTACPVNPADYSFQIHNRYEGKDISKHKRNLVIAGGVTLSVIVSPVVAAVTVGEETFSPLCFFFCCNTFFINIKYLKRLVVGHLYCWYQHTGFKHVSPASLSFKPITFLNDSHNNMCPCCLM